MEYIKNNLMDLSAIIISGLGVLGSFIALVRTMIGEKRVGLTLKKFGNDIIVTREGIVEAFKRAKISPDIKISLSNRMDKTFDKWFKRFESIQKKNEEMITQLMIYNTKILSYTAAYNKLTQEEKEHLKDLLNEISDLDKTVEVD